MARQSSWFRLCWIALTATLAIMVVSPTGARSPSAGSPQQWKSLNAQAEEANQAGDHCRRTRSPRHQELERQALERRLGQECDGTPRLGGAS